MTTTCADGYGARRPPLAPASAGLGAHAAVTRTSPDTAPRASSSGLLARPGGSGSPRSAGDGDGPCQTRDPIGDGSFVEARVAEDEARPPRRAELELGDGGDGDALVGGRCDDGCLVEVVGQPGDE